LPLRKIDHRFLRAPKVEGSPLPVHGLPDGLHVGERILVEKLKEETEILWVALVRRGREKEDVVARVPEEFA
jgi:hypothetical protein